MEEEGPLYPDMFTIGAVGPKGKRVFFFQGILPAQDQENMTFSLKCEKVQVAAVADFISRILENLPPEHLIPLDEISPSDPEETFYPWQVGGMEIAYSSEADEIELIMEELVTLPESALEAPEDIEPKRLKFCITREQADGLVRMAHSLMEQGRPPCQYCGEPLNFAPENQFCNCWN